MKDIKPALIWVVEILKKYHIPFQITGGLAARIYGAVRELDDIDIEIPNEQFDKIKKEVQEFIIFGPAQYKSDRWFLLLMTLNYQNQVIDISGADDTRILNEKNKEWQKLHVDFAKVEMRTIFDIKVPVIPRDELIAYKKILSRDVDIIDIAQMLEFNSSC
jgi:hypothetical protein